MLAQYLIYMYPKFECFSSNLFYGQCGMEFESYKMIINLYDIERFDNMNKPEKHQGIKQEERARGNFSIFIVSFRNIFIYLKTSHTGDI